VPHSIPRILITPGEPAGIGPEITAKIAQQSWNAELIAVGDSTLLQERARQIGLPLSIQPIELSQSPEPHKPGTLNCISVPLHAPCIPGKLNRDNAKYVIECLKIAASVCHDNKNQHTALVTGPVHKSIINEAGIVFTGHTELLATLFHVKQPIMLFVANELRVALATTHLPLALVPNAITQKLLIEIVEILNAELKNKFHIAQPKITVCGLNPHAGEMGHLGREEIDCIEPALHYLREKNIHVTGPVPADTIFTEKNLKNTDAILAMYHDQALPVVKYMSFGHAVNVTLGLPIIRTSVDHGTALDIAGTQHADAGSLAAAIKLAVELTSP
jgi:4-hydroxythreonine-4-phosphate dehydrogenase